MKKTEHINSPLPEEANYESLYDRIIPKYGKEADNSRLNEGEIDELFEYSINQENLKKDEYLLEHGFYDENNEDNNYLEDNSKNSYPQEQGFYDNTDGGSFFENTNDYEFQKQYFEIYDIEPPEIPESEEIDNDEFDIQDNDRYWEDFPKEDYSKDYSKEYPPENPQENNWSKEEEKYWMTNDGISIKSSFYGIESYLREHYIEKIMIKDHYSNPLSDNKTSKPEKLVKKDLSNEKGIEDMNDFNWDIVGPLSDSLKDSDRNVRKEAANALGMIADPKSVEYLIEALNDSEERVILSIVEALGKIGDERAISPLSKLLDKIESPKIQFRIMESLMEIGNNMKENYPETNLLNNEDIIFTSHFLVK